MSVSAETRPDYDDVEAEEKALDHVRRTRGPMGALPFLVAWPALDRAAALVTERAADLEGVFDKTLIPAADALAARNPLAATLALRAVIDHAIGQGHTIRDKEIERYLLDCSGLAASIPDFGDFETHDAYEARLRRKDERNNRIA